MDRNIIKGTMRLVKFKRALELIRQGHFDEIKVRSQQSLGKLYERYVDSAERNYIDKFNVIDELNLKTPELQNIKEAIRNNKSEIANELILNYYKTKFDRILGSLQQPSSVKAYREIFPYETRNLINKANDICEKKFNLLGHRSLYFGNPVDWHLDPISKRKAERKYWTQIDYLNCEEVGDKKVIWELNRHQYLFSLAQAYWITKDEGYSKEFVDQMVSWMDSNPPKFGINWCSSLEISLRIISWIWAFSLFKDSKIIKSQHFINFLKFIFVQAEHVRNYLSFYFSPNTHLLGEALGLFYAGNFFPEFKKSHLWLKLGEKILLDELDRQVRDDGVYFEQSTCYQRYAIDIYIHFLIMAKKFKIGIDYQNVERKLQKMMDFIMYISKPDGKVPAIGDSDSGRILFFDDDDSDNLRSCMCTGATLFERGDYKFIAGNFHQETFWLLGPDSIGKYKNIKTCEPSLKSASFSNSGFYVMRDSWSDSSNYLLVDCGPHGEHHCGHSHSDILSFELAALGETLILDPNTYCYTESKQWRDFFRGTSAHNTCVVDNKNQSEISDVFKWNFIAQADAINWFSNEKIDYMKGSHNGYKRLDHPIIHTREIIFVKPHFWIINDLLEGSGYYKFDLYFHLVPCKINIIEPEKSVFIKRKSGAFLIKPLYIDDTSLKIFEGSINPIQGWLSTDYGVKIPSPTVNYVKKCQVPTNFTTLLYGIKNGNYLPRIEAEDLADRKVDCEKCKGGRRMFRINNNDKSYNLTLINNYDLRIESSGDVVTNAEFFTMDRVQNRPSYIFATKVSLLNINENISLEFKEYCDLIFIDFNSLSMNLVSRNNEEYFLNFDFGNRLNQVVVNSKNVRDLTRP